MAFGALVLGADGISRGYSGGWAALAVCAVSTALVVRRAVGQTAPLFPADLLRIPIFGLSIGVSMVSFCAQLIAAVSLPFLFQRGLGRTVVETGVLMTPWPVATAVASMGAGVLSDKLPSAVLNSIGLLAMALGLFLLAFMPGDIGNLGIAGRMAICGAGFGFFQSPNNRTLVLAAPLSRSGATGGAIATARTTGQCLGAVLAAILFRALPLSQAAHWALIAAGGLVIGGAVLSGLRLGQAPPPATHRPEATLEAMADPG
jgi:DHA2 family multidrug resistance protein-like MFS transporter